VCGGDICVSRIKLKSEVRESDTRARENARERDRERERERQTDRACEDLCIKNNVEK
jgi:hypothetical protein